MVRTARVEMTRTNEHHTSYHRRRDLSVSVRNVLILLGERLIFMT